MDNDDNEVDEDKNNEETKNELENDGITEL